MCEITTFVTQRSGIWLTPLFWDCECEEDYIRPASDDVCWRCQAAREGAPDARVSEVIKYADTLPRPLVAVVESAYETAFPDAELIPFS